MQDIYQKIADRESAENILEITGRLVEQLSPDRVYLFGSFATGNYQRDSDFDFYIVMPDGENVGSAADRAYKSIRYVQKRPVDIVVGTSSRFDRIGPSRDSLLVEGEVYRHGLLLYQRGTDGRYQI